MKGSPLAIHQSLPRKQPFPRHCPLKKRMRAPSLSGSPCHHRRHCYCWYCCSPRAAERGLSAHAATGRTGRTAIAVQGHIPGIRRCPDPSGVRRRPL